MLRSSLVSLTFTFLGLASTATAAQGTPLAAPNANLSVALDPPPSPPSGYHYIGTTWHDGVLCWTYVNDQGNYHYIPVTAP